MSAPVPPGAALLSRSRPMSAISKLRIVWSGEPGAGGRGVCHVEQGQPPSQIDLPAIRLANQGHERRAAVARRDEVSDGPDRIVALRIRLDRLAAEQDVVRAADLQRLEPSRGLGALVRRERLRVDEAACARIRSNRSRKRLACRAWPAP